MVVEYFAGRFDHMDDLAGDKKLVPFWISLHKPMLKISLLVFTRAFLGIWY